MTAFAGSFLALLAEFRRQDRGIVDEGDRFLQNLPVVMATARLRTSPIFTHRR